MHVVWRETPVGFGPRWVGSHRQPSITFRGVFVGRTGRWSVAGDLRPAGMRPGQCGGEGDAGAGDLCAGRVRKSERRGDGDSERHPSPPVAETTTAVSWFAPLSMVMVWPALKPIALATGITVAPTSVAAPAVVAPAVPTVAIDGGLLVRARIDQ